MKSTQMNRMRPHFDAHNIDVSYLLYLEQYYEKGFLSWIELEGDLVASIANLEINLAKYKGNLEDEKYLFNKNLIATLASISERFSSFLYKTEKLKYEKKNLQMDNARLREQNENLKQQLLTQQKFNNV